MQIDILKGNYADSGADLRTAYPHNLEPVPKTQDISKGYLRPAAGIKLLNGGLGADRGGINWGGICYRVQGTKLIKLLADNTIVTIGDVGTGGFVTFTYSFDYLAIASGGRLYYYDGSILEQNTDEDLGNVLGLIWVDGYFMTTDGEFLVITELNDPHEVNPLKYGSSEIDPDPIMSIHKLRNEVYAVNADTIEVFQNIGSNGFPFQRIRGAQIPRGAVGRNAATIFDGKIAFVGSGANEPPAVYIAINGTDEKISTGEIDEILEGYSAAEIADVVLEARVLDAHKWLYIHLPDKTLVFDAEASRKLQEFVWFTLSSGTNSPTRYPARGFVWCYNKWICADPVTGKIGELVYDVSSHFGDLIKWHFNVGMLYNEGLGAIVHELELVCLTGNTALGDKPMIITQHSHDGLVWSQPRTASAGRRGQSNKRIAWRQMGKLDNWRVQRFSGSSDAHISVLRLEARLEGLSF